MTNKILFSIPCAGGRARNYDLWKKKINFDLVNLEYPGHWDRWEEKLCDNYLGIVCDFEKKIYDYIKDSPEDEVFLAGHSMGALLTWIIAERLKDYINLKGVIVMAMIPPSRAGKLIFDNLHDDAELISFLRNIRQVPEKTLSSDIFVEYIYPTIKNDFKIFNELAHNRKIFKKLNIPCLVLYGNEDPLVDTRDLKAWSSYASMVKYIGIDGDHFFPYCSRQVSIVCEEMTRFVYRV